MEGCLSSVAQARPAAQCRQVPGTLEHSLRRLLAGDKCPGSGATHEPNDDPTAAAAGQSLPGQRPAASGAASACRVLEGRQSARLGRLFLHGMCRFRAHCRSRLQCAFNLPGAVIAGACSLDHTSSLCQQPGGTLWPCTAGSWPLSRRAGEMELGAPGSSLEAGGQAQIYNAGHSLQVLGTVRSEQATDPAGPEAASGRRCMS